MPPLQGDTRNQQTPFMHCKVTTQIWAMFTAIAGINWIMPEHTADLLSCYQKRRKQKPKNMVEDSPSLHLVDHLEGEEPEDL